jgi:hypothetical protein
MYTSKAPQQVLGSRSHCCGVLVSFDLSGWKNLSDLIAQEFRFLKSSKMTAGR